MQKKFITNLALLLLLNLLIKPIWMLGIDREVQNVISNSADYGVYFALFNFSFLFNIFLDFGITNFNNKNIAQNNQLLTKHLSSILILKFMLAGIYMVIALSIGFAIGYSSNQLWMLFLLAFNQFLVSFILYLRSNLAGLHLFKTDSLVSVMDRTIMIAICVVLLWGNVTDGEFKIEWFVYAQFAGYFITALITFFLVIAKAEFLKLRWNYSFFQMILKQSFPYAILVLLMTFYNRIDTVMLERMLPDGAVQSGIYAQAYRLLDSANMIAYLFAGLLLPIFARMIKLKQRVEDMVKLSASLLLAPALIVAIGSYFYSGDLMNLMYVKNIENSAVVFGILMSCFVAVSTTYIFGTLLTANGNLKHLNFMALIGMLINLTLNLILIPKYQATGAAISSLITQVLTASFQVFIAVKVFKMKTDYAFVIKFAVFTLGVFFIAVFSKYVSNSWMINFALMTITAFIWAFVTRLISIKSIYMIIKSDE